MARAAFEALDPYNDNSFLLREFTEFTAPYHFHPEHELTLIVKGKGNRYVGNHMDVYSSGDLVLIGSNLPHCWKIENNQKENDVASVVIQFNNDFLGTDFLAKPELSQILHLLERSKHGIQFLNNTAKEITNRLILLAKEQNPFKRLIEFLEILYTLATSKEYILLDQQDTKAQPSGKTERINTVLGYIIDNYKNEISLDQAAALINMTPNAFCKYYKKTTKKTFIETVTDYRINYAIQQLVNSDKSISDICFENGFGDLSHFYKLFKRKMKLSPLKYRKEFRKDVA
ncbi:AraC family transcriptional regulator [Pedobacter foliorum]|uniref:AraC family transcriptional regulator n=1 Tax=Pedobacter foliorum TaxID=2739058 RepID=UPI001563A013|nr:AraC family transcriptional regulator [Pedobacter foliorum]NRF41147.1 AraC family transcriptional regulator [Pedobacter foliorum]